MEDMAGVLLLDIQEDRPALIETAFGDEGHQNIRCISASDRSPAATLRV
jgi:hypothetical protein